MTAPGYAATTRAIAYKTAMRDTARAILPDDTQIVWGHPGNVYGNRILAVMDMTTDQQPGPMGPRRNRDETLILAVVALVTVAGSDDTAQEEAETGAVGLIATLEQYVRVTDTTLGGAVSECWLTSLDVQGYTPDEQRSAGWASQVIATFTAKARITTV